MGGPCAPAVCAGPGAVRKASQPFPSMVPDARLPEKRASPAHNARASRGGACAPAPARRGGGKPRGQRRRQFGVGDRLRSCVPPSGPGAGRGVPVSRVMRAGLRARAGGRLAAARFVRLIARARMRAAGQRACLSRPLAPGVLRPPAMLSAESGKAAPGAALLSCLFYTIPRKVKLFMEQKMKILDNFLTTC